MNKETLSSASEKTPTTKTIETVTDLLKWLEFPSALNIYRGQGKERGWPLLPSIARLPSKVMDGFGDWDILEETFMSNFKRFSLPYLNTKPLSSLEWLILARNYGIPTRILDWTTNPLKALFFAVEDLTLDKYDGVLWNLEFKAFFKEDKFATRHMNKNDQKSLTLYIPPHDNPRVASQEGIYILFPFPKAFKPIQPLEAPNCYKDDITSLDKFIVPKKNKEVLRKELSNLGISHMSLFPGLDGVAKTVLQNFDMLL